MLLIRTRSDQRLGNAFEIHVKGEINSTVSGSCVLKTSVDRVSVDTLGRYVDRQSADMSTDSRPICRPTVGRYVDRQSADMSTDTRPICRPRLGRYIGRLSVDTHVGRNPPILHRHSANTTLIWSALVTEFYLLYSTVK